MSRSIRLFNRVAFGLYAFIGLLLLTGGYYHRSDSFQFELAQVDPFAWAILVLWVVRYQLQKRWLTAAESKVAGAALRFIQRQPVMLLTVGIFLYVAFHFWILSWRYDSFHSSAFDLSYILQALWSTAHGEFLRSSISTGGTYLGEHFSPILAVFAPLCRLSGSAYALFLIQSFLLGGSALLVYKIARARRVPREWAVVLGSLFLCYQPLRSANIFSFREDDLFVPVFLLAFWLHEKQRNALFFMVCLLSWAIKENAGAYTALMGAWLCLKAEKPLRRLGFALAALSLAEFLFINRYVTPHFSGTVAQTMLAKRLGWNANGADWEWRGQDLLAAAKAGLARFLQRENIRYAYKTLAPFIPFAWASPLVFGIAAMGLASNIVLGVGAGFHYECVLIPFLFYVLIRGVERALAGTAPVFRRHPIGRPELLMTLALLFLLFFGRSPAFTIRDFRPDERDAFIAKTLSRIPREASITAQPIIHPHVCERRDAFLFGPALPDTDYVILDLSPWRDRWGASGLDKIARSLERPSLAQTPPRTQPDTEVSAAYEKAVDTDGFLIFKKSSAPPLLLSP